MDLFFLRYDTLDSDSKEQWDNYIWVVDELKDRGYEFIDPYVEHDCISGNIQKTDNIVQENG